MARGQLSLSRNSVALGLGRDLVWVQGALRYLRSVHGYRRYLWTHARHHGQGIIPVSILSSNDIHKLTLVAELIRRPGCPPFARRTPLASRLERMLFLVQLPLSGS